MGAYTLYTYWYTWVDALEFKVLCLYANKKRNPFTLYLPWGQGHKGPMRPCTSLLISALGTAISGDRGVNGSPFVWQAFQLGVIKCHSLEHCCPSPPLHSYSWSPEEEVEASSACSGLSSIALILWARGLPAHKRATVLLPLFPVFLWKVSRCVLAFCSGCWVGRSRDAALPSTASSTRCNGQNFQGQYVLPLEHSAGGYESGQIGSQNGLICGDLPPKS